MHLLPCSPPNGSLEPAPRTSLRSDSAQERWEGFWGVADDRYYARCSGPDGSVQWHCFADKPAKARWSRNVRGTTYVSVRGTSATVPVARRTSTSPTLTLDTRRTMLFGVYGRRSVLVRLVRHRRTRSAR